MKYFFILGRNPDLSILELCALLRSEGYTLSQGLAAPTSFIADISPSPSLQSLMTRLGGTIKIGTLIQEKPIRLEEPSLVSLLQNFLDTLFSQKNDRITFGFSAYTISQNKKKEKALASFLFRLGLSLKKLLKEKGYACRFVPCANAQAFLSSVSVQKNNLLPPNGSEFVFLEHGGAYFLGYTHVVQPFEEYSFRDWNRPQKNMEIGLLPPKLAQIMLNLSGCSPSKNHSILDPFCGFGTIVQEALLMGFLPPTGRVQGSDINAQTVLHAQKNLSWLAEKKHLSFPINNIKKTNATRLSRAFQRNSFDAIVTEPYLGPIIHSGERIPPHTIHALSSLYTDFLQEAFLVLKATGTLVLALPVWLQKNGSIFLPIDEVFQKVGFVQATLSSECAHFIHRSTSRNTILYSRPGQSVGREIVVLKKK